MMYVLKLCYVGKVQGVNMESIVCCFISDILYHGKLMILLEANSVIYNK